MIIIFLIFIHNFTIECIEKKIIYLQTFSFANLITQALKRMGNQQNKSEQIKTPIVPEVQKATTSSVKKDSIVLAAPVQPNTSILFSSSSQGLRTVRSWVENITDSLLQVGPWIRRQKQECINSEYYENWRDFKTSFNNHVKEPLCNLYSTIPSRTTEAKFQLISPYTYNQRFTALNFFCALTAVGTITSSAKINPFSKLLRATRNVGFVYIIGGLLIAPEVYNPLIRKN